jgi:hypothetical protein
MAAMVPLIEYPSETALPVEAYRLLYAGALALCGFIGFSVLKIPGGWSNPLYIAPLFVCVVLSYGMFFYVWAACLAGPYLLAEITSCMLPIRIRSILVFVAFAASVVCADMAVHMGELG